MSRPIIDSPIALVGMGSVFPNAFDVPSYWSALLRKDTSSQRTPPLHRWDYLHYHSEDRHAVDKGYSGLGGYINGFQFDAARARCTPEEALALDEEEQWLLTAMAECLGGARPPEGRLAVFMGGTALVDSYTTHQLHHAYMEGLSEVLDERLGGGDAVRAERRAWLRESLRKSLGLVTGGRPVQERMMHRSVELMVRRMLGVDLQPVLLDAACASSLYAIDLGIQALAEGSVDVAYCGGYFIWRPLGQVLFCKLGGLSPRGCFPFDERADGTLFGDGAGVVALKRLADAVADGDRIHAVIRGAGTASDGRGKAVYAPNSRGQVRAMRRAFARTDLSPATVQYVSAHATGTPLGDATEYKALLDVYGGVGLPRGSVGLGSVKGLFGHLGWAAGVASVIQMALALQAKQIPPQANFEKLSPSIDLAAGPFVIDTEARPWPENRDGLPRRAGLSGFGFGGTDAHLIIDEWRPEDAPPAQARRGVRSLPSVPEERPERIALVSVGCVFPGARSLPEALERVSSGTPRPPLTFNGGYPINNIRYRMIPRAARVTDPLQFMLLDAVAQALEPLEEHRAQLGEETDVYIGYVGALKKCIDQSKRVYWDGVREALLREAAPQERPAMEAAFMTWKERVHDALPPSTEDSFPGIMPNLLSGRVSNHYDLQGLNECINAGSNSLAVALEVGLQALRRRNATMAMVGVVSGPMERASGEDVDATGTPPGEGAAVFCLMREQEAVARGLPVLALLEPTNEADPEAPPEEAPIFGTLHGGKGLVSMLAALAALARGARQARLCLGEQRLSLRAVNPAAGPGMAASGDAPMEEPVELTQRMRSVLLEQPARATEGFDARTLRLDSALVVCSSTDVLRRLRGQFPGARFLVTACEAEHAEALAQGASWVIDPEDEQTARHVVERVPPTDAVVAVLDLAPFRDLASSPRLEALFWLTFRLLQRWNAQPEERMACAAVVLADARAVPSALHPSAGLFTGMMKTLRYELPAARLKALVLDHGRLDGLDARLADELGNHEVLVHERGGRREVVRLTPEAPSGAERNGELALDERSVVLAVGGGKGITASSVEALLRRYRCKVVLLGRTAPDQGEPGLTRADFIARERARGETASVRVLNERFDALAGARELRDSLTQMKALPGQVDYRVCDVTDAEQTRRVIGAVLAEYGRVDLVLYGAGTIGLVAPLPVLREEGARAALPGKVAGLLNVDSALEGHPFKQFFIFSSLASLGMDGMSTYSAANEFQNGFAAWRNALEGGKRYRSLCWPAWGEAGIARRNASLRDWIDQGKRFSLISTQEGCARLLRELPLRDEDTAFFMGALEVADRPWQFVQSPARPVPLPEDPARGFFYIDDLERPTPSVLEARRVLDLERDSYLKEHCVDGEPVLPGTFMLEMAAEAALALAPRLKVVALEDARFLRFVKLVAGRPVTLRLRAERVAMASGRAEVAVTLRSDFVSPKGVVLQKDRVHFTCRVVLRETLPAAPAAELAGLSTAGERPVPDPYHAPGTPIRLEGVFITLAERWSSPEHARARYENRIPEDDPRFSRFVLPSLLLDGALRVAALRPVRDSLLPVFAPLGIGRIELYEGHNDLALREAHGTLEVRCTGQGPGLVYEVTTPRGAVFLRAHGIEAHPVGYFDTDTGRYQTEAEPEELTVERVIDLDRERHLRTAARLEGVSVLPGSFQLELAASVAEQLCAGWTVTRLGPVSFQSVPKLRPGSPLTLRLHARLKERTKGARRVEVRLTSDVVHRSGRVLVRDRLHSTLEVHLARQPEPAPPPLPFDPARATSAPHIPMVLYLRASPLHLGEYFTSVWNTQVDGEVVRSTYRNAADVSDPLFSRHRLPPLLLDAVLQNGLARRGHFVSTGIPKSLQCVRIFRALNDAEIAERYEHLLLYTLKKPDEAGGQRMQVVTPDGEVLMEVEGFVSTTLGWIDTRTGELASGPAEPTPLVRYRTVLQAVEPPATTAGAGKLSEGTLAITNEPAAHPVLAAAAPGVEVLPLSQRWEAGSRRALLAYFSLKDLGNEPEEVVERWSRTRPMLSALFALGREVSAHGVALDVVCTDAWLPSTSAPHPFASAVRGFLGSLRHEFPGARVRLVVTGPLGASEALQLLAREGSAPATDFASFHREGVRYVERLEPAPAIPAEDGALTPDSVVLLTGGGRGIGPLLARKLHERHGCRLVLLGRSEPATQAEGGASKVDFLRTERERAPGTPMSTLLARFEKQAAARELRRELDRLRAMGARVEYYACDVNDAEAVARAVERARKTFGRLDVVVHGAAVEHSALLANKRWENFSQVFDTKVEGFLHLYRALKEEPPRVWLSFGSTHSRFGTEGQVDYGAANACLDGFSALLEAFRPMTRWATLSWPMWSDVGMAARRPELFDTERARGAHILPAAEGARLFLGELEAAPLQATRVVFETEALVDHHGLRAGADKPGPEAPLLDTVTRPRPDVLVATRRLDLERDPYLREHLAEGDPSMPGCVEMELAMELLRHEYPDWKVASLRELTQVRFVKVFHQPLPLRVVATRLAVSRECVRVQVELRSDFQHRSGRILGQDRLHWSAEVELRRTLPPPPERRYAVPGSARSLPVAGYDPAAPVYYMPMIRNLVWRKQTADGATWARCTRAPTGWEPTPHPVLPYAVVDALGLTPGRARDGEGELLMGNRAEEIRLYASALEPDPEGDLFVRCGPLVEHPDGTLLCPSMAVFRGDGRVVAELMNGHLSSLGRSF